MIKHGLDTHGIQLLEVSSPVNCRLTGNTEGKVCAPKPLSHFISEAESDHQSCLLRSNLDTKT